MKSRGILVAISAPSGAGKTTIAREVLRRFPDFRFSVSATTRDKRRGEVDGKDYYFVTKQEFEKMIADDALVEHEQIYSDYYGTPKSEVEKALSRGDGLVFDVDVNGALSIKRKYPQAVLIFIKPPSVETLRNRLENRGSESSEQVRRRLERVPMELEKGELFDYIVINDQLERAVKEVFDIISRNLTTESSEKESSNGTETD